MVLSQIYGNYFDLDIILNLTNLFALLYGFYIIIWTLIPIILFGIKGLTFIVNTILNEYLTIINKKTKKEEKICAYIMIICLIIIVISLWVMVF